jgi:hypothetical protein
MVVAVEEFVSVILGSVVLSLVVLVFVWPRIRDARRLGVIALACAVGILVWNIGLNVTNAGGLNVDSPVLGLSVQDVGSGVLASIATLVALTAIDRGTAASRRVSISAVVGLLTIVVDRFA